MGGKRQIKSDGEAFAARDTARQRDGGKERQQRDRETAAEGTKPGRDSSQMIRNGDTQIYTETPRQTGPRRKKGRASRTGRGRGQSLDRDGAPLLLLTPPGLPILNLGCPRLVRWALPRLLSAPCTPAPAEPTASAAGVAGAAGGARTTLWEPTNQPKCSGAQARRGPTGGVRGISPERLAAARPPGGARAHGPRSQLTGPNPASSNLRLSRLPAE